MSLRRDEIIIVVVDATSMAVAAHVTDEPAFKSAAMRGSAVDTQVVSSVATKKTSEIVAKTI